jgi:hypothetical protein
MRHPSLFAFALAITVAAGTACTAATTDDVESGEAQLAEAEMKRPWDFVYVYPDANTIAERDKLLGLSDVGLDQKFFDAALGHMSGRFKLPGASADDAPVSPDDPQIVHEACIRDPKSWRVTQVRFAPYEMGLRGTVSAYQTWSRAKGSRLDRLISVRLSVHPFCGFEGDPTSLQREDQAMHLVYSVAPTSPERRDLAASVFGQAQEFAKQQTTGTNASRTASYVALEKHRAALASPAWGAFRKEVLLDWAKLARKATVGDDAFAALDAQAKSFRSVGVAPFQDRVTNPEPGAGPTFEHPALRDPDGPVRIGLRALVQKYARPDRLSRAALMFTVGSQDALDDFQETRWFFSQLEPGRYEKLAQMPAGADAVYGAYKPAALDTFIAIGNERGVDFVRVTSAGFYSESRGAFTGPKNVYAARMTLGGRSVDIKREVDKVDYEQAVTIDPDEGHDMAKLPKGRALKAAMDRFSNVEVTNASTTGCDRCHNAQNFMRTDSEAGWRPSARQESAYQFHMITANVGMSLRTIRELDSELAQARVELAPR